MMFMVKSTEQSKKIDLQRLAAVLETIGSIEFAMVFGSAQDGVMQAGSDLDVAVWLSHADAGSISRLSQIVAKVEDAFAVTCDLTVLNTAGTVLRHEALKGCVLFVRPGCEDGFSRFYVLTCAQYEDLIAWRARQLAYRGYVCPSTAL
jgi:predicted nucleotidyltransferase